MKEKIYKLEALHTLKKEITALPKKPAEYADAATAQKLITEAIKDMLRKNYNTKEIAEFFQNNAIKVAQKDIKTVQSELKKEAELE